jgi:uncharacterized protein
MSKILFWLLVVFAVLLALRVYNASQLRRREQEAKRRRESQPRVEAMVRCTRCGTYLPRTEARVEQTGPVCASGCDPSRNR